MGAKLYYALAYKFLDKACKSNDGNGCLELGILQSKGLGPDDGTQNSSLLSFEKGCNLGNTNACTNLGLYYADDKSNEGVDKARRYFEKSCNFSGLLLKDGISGKSDQKKASDFFEKACRLGSQDGCRNLQSISTRFVNNK